MPSNFSSSRNSLSFRDGNTIKAVLNTQLLKPAGKLEVSFHSRPEVSSLSHLLPTAQNKPKKTVKFL